MFLLYHLSLQSYYRVDKLLFPEGEQALPPGPSIPQSLDNKYMFAFATPPGFELLAVVCFRATAARTRGAYSGLSFFVQIAPVSIIPARACWHTYLL